MRIQFIYPGLLLAAALLPAQTLHAQTWTDRGEYDLVLAVRAEAGPARQIELIQNWKQKYPQTDLGGVRAELELAAYAALNDIAKVVAVAQQMVAAGSADFPGLYWLTLLAPAAQKVDPAFLAIAEQAAKKLPEAADQSFGPGKLAPGLPESSWQKQRVQIDVLSHRALGWIAWQRGSLDVAEQEFRACLEKNPQRPEASSWLGAVLALQNTPDKRVESIWHLARASALDDEGSLSAVQRREVRAMLERVYRFHHGDLEGLDRITVQAAASATPPGQFRIETAQEVQQRKQDELLAETNPELLTWLRVRRQLEGPDADKNFELLKSVPLGKLKGRVLRHTPATKPTEIVLALQEPSVEEVNIKLDTALTGKAEAGTVLEFEGAMAESWSAQPFLLTVRLDTGKITGWPAPGGRR
jgi:tetratricopeptide (TPR) repeat protein